MNHSTFHVEPSKQLLLLSAQLAVGNRFMNRNTSRGNSGKTPNDSLYFRVPTCAAILFAVALSVTSGAVIAQVYTPVTLSATGAGYPLNVNQFPTTVFTFPANLPVPLMA